MKYINDGFKAAYYSQIGNNHVANGDSNQDRIICEKVADDRWYMALADGVSSASNSGEGAAFAVEAVRFMTKQLDESMEWDIEKYKVDFVHFWKSKIHTDWNNFATTLNFIIYVHGRVLIGQIGDGLIYCKIDSKEEIFTDDGDFYSTETNALATQVRRSAFTMVERKCTQSLSLYMTSDGIGKEIAEDSRRRLGEYLDQLLLSDKDIIEKELKSWVSGMEEKNGDDKSIGFIKWEE